MDIRINCLKTHENKENVPDSIAFEQDAWYSYGEKSLTGNRTLTIEHNPCFRILQPDSNTERRGRQDTRLQKTVINIVQQKKDNELLHPIFNCMYEILNSKNAPAINSE